MDLGSQSPVGEEDFEEEELQRPRPLPEDLPKSLDDRRQTNHNFGAETEMYDAWQGILQATTLQAASLAHVWDRAISVSYKSNACPIASFQSITR